MSSDADVAVCEEGETPVVEESDEKVEAVSTAVAASDSTVDSESSAAVEGTGDEWESKPKTLSSTQQLYNLTQNIGQKQVVVVDTREQSVFEQSHFRYTLSVPLPANEHLHEADAKWQSFCAAIAAALNSRAPLQMGSLQMAVFVIDDPRSGQQWVAKAYNQTLSALPSAESPSSVALVFSEHLSQFENDFGFLFVGEKYAERESQRKKHFALSLGQKKMSAGMAAVLFSITSSYAKYPSLIVDNAEMRLFLGNHQMATDRFVLDDLGITHVINVTPRAPFVDECKRTAVLRVAVDDLPTADLYSHFEAIMAFVRTAIDCFKKKTDVSSSLSISSGSKKKKSWFSFGSKKPKGSSAMESAKVPSLLVHCMAGVSRSGAVVVAIVMALFGWQRDVALEFVREHRPSVCPNDGFTLQLKKWEAHCL